MIARDNGCTYEITGNNAELVDISISSKEIIIKDFIIVKKKKYNIISIREDCFQNNDNVETIILNKNIIKLKEGQFENMPKLKRIDIKNVLILPMDCFKNCPSLLIVNCLSRVQDVYPCCFSHCNSLKTIELTVRNISYRAFEFCDNLEKIILHETIKIETSAFIGCRNLKEIYLPKKCEIEKYVFLGTKNLNKIYNE